MSNIYFGTIVPKKIRWVKRKIWTMSKWLDIRKDFRNISTIKMIRYKDFWTISSAKCFNTLKWAFMATIPYRILKFESMSKKPISASHTFFAVLTFSKINSSAYNKFYRNTAFIICNPQKHLHQDNLSFVCLQFYKRSCLIILHGNICCHIQVNNQ